MTLSIRNKNHRLLILFAALLLTVGFWAIDVFPNLATPGTAANGTWFLLFGITGAIMFEFLHYDRSPSAQNDLNKGLYDNQTGHGNPYADQANRALQIWCVSLAYEILVLMFIPAILASFSISGTIEYLPGFVIIVMIIGIPVFFLIMLWSELRYVRAVKSLDPGLTKNWKVLRNGPIFLTGLFGGLFLAVLGLFLGGAIGPILIAFLPSSVSPIFNPLMTGATLALFATPVIAFWKFRRKDRAPITDATMPGPDEEGAAGKK